MTHKISPVAFRLGVSSSWFSLAHISSPNLAHVLHSDLFIRNLIQGVFLKFGIFTSPIILKRSLSGSLQISLFYWDSSSSPYIEEKLFSSSTVRKLLLLAPFSLALKNPKIKVKLIATLLEKLLTRIFNSSHPISFHISEIPSPVFNAKILCDYLAYRISLNPYYHKSVVMEALRASKSY